MRTSRVRRIIVSAATMIALGLGASLGAAAHQSAGQGDWPLKPNPNSGTYSPMGQGDWPMKPKA